jgi:hypothetical protein
MSEQGSQGPPDISSFMPGQEGTGLTDDTGQGEASLSGDFLKNIPDADRAVVSRYVKDWDSGVTKRFQDIHNEYAPYKELGSVEEIQQAIEVYNLLDNSPEVIYEPLKQHFNETQQQIPQQQVPQTPPGQLDPQIQQALDPFLKPLQSRLEEQQGLMEKMAQAILLGNQKEQEAAEDKALDQYLAELEQRHGKFDQRAILLGIYEGKDGDQAVKEWKDSLSQYMPQQQPSIPPPLMGGSVPSDNVDVGSMSNSDVKQLTAQVFAALQNGQQ